jgi:hypothetical protein
MPVYSTAHIQHVCLCVCGKLGRNNKLRREGPVPGHLPLHPPPPPQTTPPLPLTWDSYGGRLTVKQPPFNSTSLEKKIKFTNPIDDFSLKSQCHEILFVYFFWMERVCWPLLCLCRPIMIFEGCLNSNSECCHSQRARYQLSHQSPNIPSSAIHHPPSTHEI